MENRDLTSKYGICMGFLLDLDGFHDLIIKHIEYNQQELRMSPLILEYNLYIDIYTHVHMCII